MGTTALECMGPKFCMEKSSKNYAHKRYLLSVIDAPYRSAINKAILKLQESGELANLKKKWWQDERTEEKCGEVSFYH